MAVQPISGRAVLILKPQIHSHTHSEIFPYTQASIDHLVLKLFIANGPEQDLGIQKTIPNAQLANSVVFSNLRAQTTYRVKAYAYLTTDNTQPISVEASSSTDIVLTDDNQPTVATLKVQLIDRAFAGQGTSSLAITPGGYQLDGNESAQFYGPDGIVSTLAGSDATGSQDGAGTEATFVSPTGVAVDAADNVYVVDYAGNCIRKITPAGVVTTLAGNGTAGAQDGSGSNATFRCLHGMAIDGQGNLYVAEQYNHRIRKVTPAGAVTTLAGNDASGSINAVGTSATFYHPSGLAVDNQGNVYVADMWNNCIRKIDKDGVVTTFAGNGSAGRQDGLGTAATFNYPNNVTLDSQNNLYVADWHNYLIRKVTPAGQVSTYAGSGTGGYQDGALLSARINDVEGMVVDKQGFLYLADRGNHCIRKIYPNSGIITLAGSRATTSYNGTGILASFNRPHGLAIDSQGNLYVGEFFGHRVRKIR